MELSIPVGHKTEAFSHEKLSSRKSKDKRQIDATSALSMRWYIQRHIGIQICAKQSLRSKVVIPKLSCFASKL